MKDSQKAKLKQKICDVREEDWASDCDDEEDLESLPDAKQFREVLRDWCVRNGYDIEFIKNETSRITAKCKVDGCEWRIHASPIMKGPTFQIKTLKGNHTCARTYQNSLAKATYLATRMESSIRDHPDIPIQQLKNRILRKCNVEVSRFKVLRAKKKALEAIRGSDALQYDKLWDYCETVRKCNPGSKLILRKLENSDPPVFDRMYFSLWALKKGFLEGCRPIIGLDGCFLKTCYGGQLLVAVGRDGNDNMFPIAMAVVQVENRETWSWFLTEMLDDIGGLGTSKWSFISDRQKGLIEALKELVPDSEHRFCTRHMYQNFKQKFKSVELKEYFWKAASIANKQDFERYMKKIQEIDPKVSEDVETAYEWLESTSFEPLKPPAMKKQRGRPKKLRRRGPDELSQSKVSTRKGLNTPAQNAWKQAITRTVAAIPLIQDPNTSREVFLKRSLKDLRHLLQAKNKLLNKLERGILRTTPLQDKKEENMFLSESLQLQGKGYLQRAQKCSFIGMTASIQTTVEQTPMATNLGTNDGSGGPSHSIPEKGRYKKRTTITQVLENIKERSKKRPWKP
ncbi:hypothetical protein Sango_1680700 [Sesamum angolense]|uniref:Transposase n=1 Tax=Sesamum angolense TaxID=2727404 RepID=A0AAE1WLC9_9LAMI|nr:hypothetical protein Sango_1680700 [Sesamum angolense]